MDDEGSNLRGFARLFKSSWTISLAASGEEAIAILRDQPIDVVLADQVMPGMSGTELLALIRESHPETIRCVVSGYAQSAEVLDAMKAGHAHHFFAKPWDATDLKRTLEGALERAALERERQRLLEELQIAEQRLQQEARHFRALLESAPDAIVIVDERGLVTAVNGAFEKLFGYARAEVIGRPMEILIPASDEQDHAPLRDSLVEDPRRSVSREDILAKRKDGSKLVVDIALSPLATDDGVLVITAIRDVTERVKATAALKASERLQREILEAMPLGVVIGGADGAIQYQNRAARELMGVPLASHAGHGETDQVIYVAGTDEPYPSERMPLMQALSDVRAYAQDLELRTPTGRRLVEAWASPLHDEEGAVKLAIAAFSDITERRRVEAEIGALNEELEARVEARTEALARANAELWESENHFRHLFEESRDAIILRSEEAFVDCNERALEMFGCVSKEEFLGLRPAQLSPSLQPDGRPSAEALRQHIAACLQEGGMLFEWTHRRRDGTDIPCEVQLSSVIWGESRIVQAAVRDITERKRTEEAIRRARDAAESANRAKSTFIAGMSHEIRTPMNAVLGFTRLLQQEPTLGTEHRSMVDEIGRSGEHLLLLINAVLEMSKIDAGHVEIDLAAFDLVATVRDLELMFRGRVEEAGSRFSVVADDLPRFVVTDAVKLRHILVNLLSNALKFTVEGSITMRAWTTSTESDLRLIVDVEDTGEGIAKSDLERVFEKFAQTDQGRNRGGTGLGLATSREYARLLGGDLTVESEAGRGSRFHVEVPIELSLEAPVWTEALLLSASLSPVGKARAEHATSASGAPRLVLPEAISSLPPALAAHLRETTVSGDFDALIALIDGMPEEHREVAEGLRRLANAFEYDRLLLLLDPIGGEA